MLEGTVKNPKISPGKEADFQMGVETYDQIEAACCIWEALLETMKNVDHQLSMGMPCDVWDLKLLQGFQDHGASEMRHLAITHAHQCHMDYAKAVEDGYDDAFDWDFVPTWVEENFKV
jgi:hypothetical protein